MSDLEESIERIGCILALSPSMHEGLKKALHAFAAAISAKASEVQGEKPDVCTCYKIYGYYRSECSNVSNHHKEMTTEPKESDCPCNKYPEADLRHCTCEPTPELPKCPVCDDTDCIESNRHDQCTACGWAQMTPMRAK